MFNTNNRLQLKKRITFAVVLFLAFYLLPFATVAQDVPQAESLEIALWPEYDRSEMLVIMRMRLASNVQLPVTVEIPIPTRVGEPLAVAKWDPDIGPNDQVQWSRIEDDEWSKIAIETDTAGVWLEYYDVLTLDGDERSYSFQWPGGVEIGSLRFKVQQPQAADSMRVSDATDVVDEGGFKYHVVDAGSLQATDRYQIDISYFNSTGQLTNPATIVRPEATRGGTPDISAWLPYLIGGFGFLMLILGAVLWFRLQRDVGSGSPRRRRRRRTEKDGESQPERTTRAQRFCQYCGNRANPDDNFCRNCGTKLRQG